MGIYDMIDTKNAGEGFVLQLARTFNREWYEQLPEENQFLQKLRGLEERAFSGSFRLKPGSSDKAGDRHSQRGV